jgi:hypothetical protein
MLCKNTFKYKKIYLKIIVICLNRWKKDMKVTNIKQSNYDAYQPIELKKSEPKQVSGNIEDKMDISGNKANWQKNILMDALTSIENNIQLDNIHPLDRVENQPIENFDQALIELNFIHSPFFKAQASGAQANLKPQDILNLFREDAA